MSKQDEILGKHPAEHPCLGVWLDCEDKEGTDTSCIRVLSEKATFNQQINDWFANKLLEYHYSPRAISSVKIKLENWDSQNLPCIMNNREERRMTRMSKKVMSPKYS